jgi:hypothetical protein
MLLTEYQAMKVYGGSGRIAPRILDLGTRWRCVVSFMTRERAPDTIGYEAGWAPEQVWTPW